MILWSAPQYQVPHILSVCLSTSLRRCPGSALRDCVDVKESDRISTFLLGKGYRILMERAEAACWCLQ